MNKTQRKTALAETIRGALSQIADAVVDIGAETARHLATVGVFEVRAGIGLDIVKTTMAEAKTHKVSLAKTKDIGTDDWRVIARDKVPGKDVKTLYRWQNAGAVARVLGDDIGDAVVGSLVPLYRILSALTKTATPEDRATAEDLVRSAWAEALADAGKDETGTQIVPDADAVKVIAERLAPTTRSGGTETTTTEDDDEDDDDGETTEDETEDGEGAETRRESSDSLVVVDPVAVESASANWTPVLRQITEAHGVSADVVSAIGLAVLRFGAEHGYGTMSAVLAGASAPTTDAPEASA